MKVSEFFAIARGSISFSFSESEEPLCGADFIHEYRLHDEWNKDIDNIVFLPRKREENGLLYDNVICLITCK